MPIKKIIATSRISQFVETGSRLIDSKTDELVAKMAQITPAQIQLATTPKGERLFSKGWVVNLQLRHYPTILKQLSDQLAPLMALEFIPDQNPKSWHITVGDIRQPKLVTDEDAQLIPMQIPLSTIANRLRAEGKAIPSQKIDLNTLLFTPGAVILTAKGNGWIQYFREQLVSILETELQIPKTNPRFPKLPANIIHCTIARFETPLSEADIACLKQTCAEITTVLTQSPIIVPVSELSLTQETKFLGGVDGDGFLTLGGIGFLGEGLN